MMLRTTLAASAGAVLLLGCSESATGVHDEAEVSEALSRQENPECAADNGGITLPDGFCATVFADELGAARHIAVTSKGDVYVAIADANDGSAIGGVAALRDADGDGVAETVERFSDAGGNGIAVRGRTLYFAQNDRVLRYRLDGQLTPTEEPDTLVSGLPIDGDHNYKTIVLQGSDLYINHGSASNSCQVENRQLESPGVDPCPELAVRAGVWRFAANELDQQLADGERIATGTRNVNALALLGDRLFAVQNGRDQLFENWPEIYTQEDDQQAPAEELFEIEQDRDYGWPYCYFDARLDRHVLAPEYGGDGESSGRCADLEAPLTTYPAHWAPLAITFYRGRTFPKDYRGGAFITNHGSRFAPEAQGDLPGYNVIFQPFEGDRPSGDYQEFATGFAGDGRPLPDAARYRPVGVAVGPDGALYISDDKVGRVWKVVAR